MRPLEKWQRTKLETIQLRLNRTFSEVWGTLPPSSERENIRLAIAHAEQMVINMLREPEQITMEDFVNEDNGQ